MKKNRKRRRKSVLLRLQYVLTGAAVICVAVITLLLVNVLRDEKESRPGSDAGPALLESGEDTAAATETEIEIMTDGKRNERKEDVLQSPEELASESGVPRIRIVLDPGHGGPGTSDEQELGAKYRDTFEKYLTLKIARAAGEELSTYGNVEVLYTRETDKALTLKERAAYAKAVDGDCLISFHLNASEEHNFFGSEVFTSAFGTYYAFGKGMGDQVLKQLEADGFVSKGVKTRLGRKGSDYYGIIRESKEQGIPAIIIEHGYMDQDGDWSRMDTDEKLIQLGKSDAAGIAAFYGLQKGKNLPELPERDIVEPASSPVRPDTTDPVNVCYTLSRQDTANAQITLHAEDPDSRVMYYDYSTDAGATWSELYLWPEGTGDDITFTVPVTEAEEPNLLIRAYNTYELRTEAVRK